jgi:hypothetical protein
LSSLSSAVEASNHYRKESKKLSSFLELRRGRHDTTNCITTVAGKITPPPLYSLLPRSFSVLYIIGLASASCQLQYHHRNIFVEKLKFKKNIF